MAHTDLIFCFPWPVWQFVLSGVDGARGTMGGWGSGLAGRPMVLGCGGAASKAEKQIKSTINGTHKTHAQRLLTQSQPGKQTTGCGAKGAAPRGCGEGAGVAAGRDIGADTL